MLRFPRERELQLGVQGALFDLQADGQLPPSAGKISYSPLRATSRTLLEISVAVIFTSRSFPGLARRNSSTIMAIEYGSWPVEQAADQIRKGCIELRSANSGSSFS